MEFLGVGPLEIFFILIIALIVLGPKDMIKTGRQLGSFLRKLVKSDTWKTIQQTSRDIRYLPNKLMREAGLDEEVKELKGIEMDLEASAKEMEASVKEVEATVIKEVETASKDMDVTLPIDELKKTVDEIDLNLSAISTPSKLETEKTIASPPSPVLNREIRPNDETSQAEPILNPEITMETDTQNIRPGMVQESVIPSVSEKASLASPDEILAFDPQTDEMPGSGPGASTSGFEIPNTEEDNENQ